MVSGGFENTNAGPDFTTDAQVWGLDSKKQGGRSWSFTGFNFGEAPGTFNVYAYCEEK